MLLLRWYSNPQLLGYEATKHLRNMMHKEKRL